MSLKYEPSSEPQVQFLVGSLPRDIDRVKVKDAAACFFLADDHAAGSCGKESI